MLGPGVIVAEGITEHSALSAVAEKMEQANPNLFALDLAGITIFPVEGDGSLPNFGSFFKALGLRTYAFYDFKPRKPEENQKFVDAFDLPNEIPFANIELLLVNQTPVKHQWTFLCALRESGDQGNIGIPAERPDDVGVRANMLKALKSNKGNGYAGGLLDLCELHELPIGITDFLTRVYSDFPKPAPAVLPGDKPVEEEDEEDLVGAL
jgi:putative ATP-dependent endonuclease of OLD family